MKLFNLHAALRRKHIAVRPQCTYITHVKQWHHPRGLISHELMREIARSQHTATQYIQDNPKAIVLQEGHDQDMLPENIRSHSLTAVTRQLFPQGIPTSFDAMNEAQAKFMAENSGAVTLYCLGQLQYIFKTTSESEARRIKSGIAVGRLDLIFEPCENLAVSWAVKASRGTQKEDVLLIYGANHNFEPCIRKINSPFIQLKKALTTVLQNDAIKTTLPDTNRKNDKSENSLLIPPQCMGDDPQALYNAFIPTPIKLLISKRCTTLEALRSVYDKSPWIIEAILTNKSIQTALLRSWVSLEKLSCLSNEQFSAVSRTHDENALQASLLQITSNRSPCHS